MNKIKKVLRNLCTIPGVDGALITKMDGITFESIYVIQHEIMSAAMAAVLGAANEMIEKTGSGDLEGIMIETRNKRILVSKINEAFALIVITNKSSKLGLVRYEIKNAKEILNKEMQLVYGQTGNVKT